MQKDRPCLKSIAHTEVLCMGFLHDMKIFVLNQSDIRRNLQILSLPLLSYVD